MNIPPTLTLCGVLLCAVPGPTAPASAADPAAAVAIETRFLRLRISPETGRCEITDKRADVTWAADGFRPHLGDVILRAGGQPRRIALEGCDVARERDGMEAIFHPLPEAGAAVLRVHFQPQGDGDAIECSYEADPALNVERIRLLEGTLRATDDGAGYALVPVREGLLVPADSDVAFTHRFDTYAYEGCHMAMFGMVQRGAAALVTWTDPYVALDLESVLTLRPTNGPAGGGRQTVSATLELRKSAKSFRIRLLGPGDYNTIARAYRQVAKDLGWRVPWSEKLKGHPERAKLFGASNFKLWSALDREMNEESTKEERVRVHWTFDEAARVAEHLKIDLKLDRVLFLMGGWIRRGYDNQHPDILPAAPECGGDDGLADCARRVRRLGYVFGLHDNYQDIYRDSPSWSEAWLMKTADGRPAVGGKWAGGRAYLTCSQKAVELARRPQNLPAVRRLTGADAYFIDTTYAAGLQECFDPNHPLTRRDDMKWKQAISDYARGVFGIFGSECGREWAIPHSDFFEGLTGVGGRHYHDAGLEKKLGATVVPLFELVYRDCIAMYGKYGYDPAEAAGYVLHHISLGRPLNYHSVPPHLYWKEPGAARGADAGDGAAVFTRADKGWAAGLHPLDRFVKNTHEILSPLNELTAQRPMNRHQFLTPDRLVQLTVFGDGPATVTVVVNAGREPYHHRSRVGGDVVLPGYGFLVESREFAAFHASTWGGRVYTAPALFTLRSLDGRPLERSRRVRVFHAFGDAHLPWGGRTETVERERVLVR